MYHTTYSCVFKESSVSLNLWPPNWFQVQVTSNSNSSVWSWQVSHSPTDACPNGSRVLTKTRACPETGWNAMSRQCCSSPGASPGASRWHRDRTPTRAVEIPEKVWFFCLTCRLYSSYSSFLTVCGKLSLVGQHPCHLHSCWPQTLSRDSLQSLKELFSPNSRFAISKYRFAVLIQSSSHTDSNHLWESILLKGKSSN